jgi:biotin carboxyl carrier protein
VSDQVKPEARVVEDPAAGHAERSAADRAADHAAIADSIDELLPALIAKLGATGLAELEVREDSLRVRLRRPAVSAAGQDGRAGERSVRGDRSRGSAAAAAPGHAAGLTPVGPGRQGRDGRAAGDGRDGPRLDEPRAVATSPAVGIYQPRAEARAGPKVRAGDRLGTVDMLGVPQEVVAPTDGLVGLSLVEPGDAVEYGQDLVMIEFAPATGSVGPTPAGTSAPSPPLEH